MTSLLEYDITMTSSLTIASRAMVEPRAKTSCTIANFLPYNYAQCDG
jgi:hypothetical protein